MAATDEASRTRLPNRDRGTANLGQLRHRLMAPRSKAPTAQARFVLDRVQRELDRRGRSNVKSSKSVRSPVGAGAVSQILTRIRVRPLGANGSTSKLATLYACVVARAQPGSRVCRFRLATPPAVGGLTPAVRAAGRRLAHPGT